MVRGSAFVVGVAAVLGAVATQQAAQGAGAGERLKGYAYTADVSQHERIDLDLQDMITELAAGDFAAALQIFQEGKYSTKSSGEKRTLKGFSLRTNLAKVPLFQVYEDYLGQNYASNFVEAALTPPADSLFAGLDEAGRAELAVKGVQFQSVWMYVLYELYAALEECEAGSAGSIDVKHWDEAWAFYVGSLGNRDTDAGLLGFGHAEKRANRVQNGLLDKQFLTRVVVSEDGGAGTQTFLSAANARLLEAFSAGKAQLASKQCAAVKTTIEQVVIPQMAVPLLQGVVRYSNGDRRSSDKGKAEGFAFAKAVVPLIRTVDEFAAATIDDAMELDHQDEFDVEMDVVDAVVSVLEGLHLTCADLWNFADSELEDADVVQRACSRDMLGYSPGSALDVRKHARIDLDLRDMDVAIEDEDWDEVERLFVEGQNSYKINDEGRDEGLRSMAGFSQNSYYDDVPLYKTFADYFGGDKLYAKTLVMDTLAGTDSSEAKEELVPKLSAFVSTWMYVVREMANAVAQCNAGETDLAAHSWDEGWAFWSGSAAIATGAQAQANGGGKDGFLGYSLAAKRQPQFASAVDFSANAALLGSFEQGKVQLLGEMCGEAAATMEQAVTVMRVPLLQGLLRYVVLVKQEPSDKQLAEGRAFAASVLPSLHQCNPAAGDLVHKHMFERDDSYDVDELVAAVRSTFACLGVTCEQVGSLVDDDSGEVIVAECPNWSLAPHTFALYKADSDVSQHARIDLDLQAMELALEPANGGAPDYATAEDIFTNGRNSQKATDDDSVVMRSLAGFSSPAKLREKLPDFFPAFENYWGSANYASDFVLSALRGTGDFAGQSDAVRVECVVKGAQYQSVFMYVLYEMADAVADCRAGGAAGATDNDGGVRAWDEAAAFYVGSRVGAANVPAGAGFLGFTLAEKRAVQFDAVGDSGAAAVNERVMGLFQAGALHLRAGACDMLEETYLEIRGLSMVPIAQGLLRYAYLTDPAVATNTVSDKERGEAWAFAAALLPVMHSIGGVHLGGLRGLDMAGIVRLNTHIKGQPMASGHREVMNVVSYAMQTASTAISAERIGALQGENVGSASGSGAVWTPANVVASKCGSHGQGSHDDNGGLVAAVVVLALLLCLALAYIARKVMLRKRLVDVDLKQTHNGNKEYEMNGRDSGSEAAKDVAQV